MAEAKQQSRKKKFIKDFGIYAIGNVGSRLITFLMYPLYSYYVEDTGDFGVWDYCLQLCMFLTPVVTLQLRDGAFRFLLDNNDAEHRTRVISYVYRTLILSTSTTILLALLISCFHPFPFLWHTVGLLVIMSFYEVIAQVIRGLGNNKAFVAVGLLASLGISVFSVIFVVFLEMGVVGIFFANILARIVSIAIVESRMKTIIRFFRIKVDVKTLSKDILKFSVPLIPVTMSGFLPPLLDRTFIIKFLGEDMVGIYSMSLKMAGVIQLLSMVFYKTWQENAIQQYNSNDRDNFFSKVFNIYVFILALLLIGYIFTLKICYQFIGPNYQSGMGYLMPIGTAWVIIAISNYFYIPYQCAKDTKSALPSIIILVVTNLILNFILVPILGVYGVITTSITGYSLVTFYLWFNTKKFFNLHIYKNTIVPVILIVLSFIPFYLNPNHFADAAYMVAALIVIVIAMPKEIKQSILQKIKKIALKKRAIS